VFQCSFLFGVSEIYHYFYCYNIVFTHSTVKSVLHNFIPSLSKSIARCYTQFQAARLTTLIFQGQSHLVFYLRLTAWSYWAKNCEMWQMMGDTRLPTFHRNILPPHFTLNMETVRFFQTLISTFMTTRCHNSQDHNMNANAINCNRRRTATCLAEGEN
jgi:hypothetical protein